MGERREERSWALGAAKGGRKSADGTRDIELPARCPEDYWNGYLC